MAIDPKGGTHSLSRRIDGATAKDVRARLADLDPRGLPSVAEAKEAQQQRQPAREPPRQAERAATARPDHAAPEAFRGKAPGRVMDSAARAVEGVAGGLLRGVGKMLDGAASLFEGLLGGGPSPEQVQQAKDSAQASPPAPEPSPPYAGFVAPSNPRQSIEKFLAEEQKQQQQQQKVLEARALAAGRPTMTQVKRNSTCRRRRTKKTATDYTTTRSIELSKAPLTPQGLTQRSFRVFLATRCGSEPHRTLWQMASDCSPSCTQAVGNQ